MPTAPLAPSRCPPLASLNLGQVHVRLHGKGYQLFLEVTHIIEAEGGER